MLLPASAIQWDGTRDGAIKIGKWIKSRGHRFDAEFHHQISPGSGNRIEINDGLEHTGTVYPGDWILSLPGKVYIVLDMYAYDKGFSRHAGSLVPWQEAQRRALEGSDV